jgi:hypothetical protein
MAQNLSTKARNAAGDGLLVFLETGSANPAAYIEFRSAPRPSSPDETATGVLLAAMYMASPAFQNFVNGSAISNTISPDTSIDNTGIASWFRIYNKDGEAVFDGNITAQGEGGEIELENISLVEGAYLAISSLRLSAPKLACRPS